MRSILAAIVGCCLYLAVGAQGESFMDKPGFYYVQRPRLGHFAVYPFTDLYLNYAASFVKPLHSDRRNDDFRNYVPSADECMVFFSNYRSNDYKIRDIEEVVILDACLGYLYQSTYQSQDKESSNYVKENLDALIEDKQLKDLFHGSNINDLPDPAKDCVGNLLLESIRAKLQFSGVSCNNEWLEVFNRFADCHQSIPAERREGDTYIHLIYDLVKSRGKACFDNEIHALNTAVRGKYANSLSDRVGNKVTSLFSTFKEQAETRVWPREIVKVLRAVQNPTKEINLHQVSNILRGVYLNDKNWINTLTSNLAARATKSIRPKRAKPMGDPSGAERYTAWVDKLCNFFRSSDNPKYYDYTTPFKRMIKMLSHPYIFDISRDYFIEKVLTGSYETAPLYLTVSSCNVMTFTEGTFNTQPENHALSYNVVFKPNLEKMVVWPDAGFY